MKPLWLMVACALAAAGCSATGASVARIGGALEVTLADSSPSSRAAVIAHCGHLPGIARVDYVASQPDTLRFLHPKVGLSDPRMSAVLRCLRGQAQVLRAVEPV